MDHRQHRRNRLLRAGTIEFHGGAIDCMVRNMSENGAALEVVSLSCTLCVPKTLSAFIRQNRLGLRDGWTADFFCGMSGYGMLFALLNLIGVSHSKSTYPLPLCEQR